MAIELSKEDIDAIAARMIELQTTGAPVLSDTQDPSIYYAIVTQLGIEKINTAYNNEETVTLVNMAVGGSNGAYVEPLDTFTQLTEEFDGDRVPLIDGTTSDAAFSVIGYVSNPAWAGRVVREFGLYDSDGDLIVYGAYPPSTLPSAASAEYIQLEIYCDIHIENASAVTIEVTPIIAHATTTEFGTSRIATEDEVLEGTNNESFVTPVTLKNAIPKFGIIDLLGDDKIDSDLTIGTSTDHIEIPSIAWGLNFLTYTLTAETDQIVLIDIYTICSDGETNLCACSSTVTVLPGSPNKSEFTIPVSALTKEISINASITGGSSDAIVSSLHISSMRAWR